MAITLDITYLSRLQTSGFLWPIQFATLLSATCILSLTDSQSCYRIDEYFKKIYTRDF